MTAGTAGETLRTTACPTDLCPVHRRIWRAWKAHRYDPQHPKDWPGQILMDARTSHAERREDWARKNLREMESTAALCRSGRSPQCTPKEPAHEDH